MLATMATPVNDGAREIRKRLDSCWNLDLAWDKYPAILREVSAHVVQVHVFVATNLL